MNPYPQKPNVTRTSRHEGSYNYEGMKREYKTKEQIRKELEARWEAGTLDESMKPYLTFLRGGTPPKRRDSARYHKKAQRILQKTNKPLRSLSIGTTAVSYEALKMLRRGDFDRVSLQYAKNICYFLDRTL